MRTPFALALVLVAAGCGGGASPPNPSLDMTVLPDLSIVGPATPSDFDVALAVAYCSGDVLCGFIGASELAACMAAAPGNQAMYPPSYSLDDAVKAGRVKYDPVAAQACIDAWLKAGCSVDQEIVAGAVCDNVYTPLVMAGGSCLADSECVGGHCNGSMQDGCMGSCVAWLGEGAACDPNNDLCDGSKDFCSSGTSKCVPLVALGATCGDDAFCVDSAFCIANPTPADAGMGDGSVGPPATCRAPGKVGEVCEVFLFENDSCSPELFCDDTQPVPVCATQKAAGADCGSDPACKDGLACVGLDFDQNTNMTILGKCGAYLDVGGTCDPTLTESGCPFNQACDMASKKCALVGLAGSDCSDNGSGGYCIDNYYCDANSVCSVTVPFGAACVPPATQNDPDPCQQGSCDAMAKKCAVQCM